MSDGPRKITPPTGNRFHVAPEVKLQSATNRRTWADMNQQSMTPASYDKKAVTALQSQIVERPESVRLADQYLHGMLGAADKAAESTQFWRSLSGKIVNKSDLASAYISRMVEEYDKGSFEHRRNILDVAENEHLDPLRERVMGGITDSIIRETRDKKVPQETYNRAKALYDTYRSLKDDAARKEFWKTTFHQESLDVRLSFIGKNASEYKRTLPEIFEGRSVESRDIAMFKAYCKLTATKDNCGHTAFEGKVDDLTVSGSVVQHDEVGADLIFFDNKGKRFVLSADLPHHGKGAAWMTRALTLYLNHVMAQDNLTASQLFGKMSSFMGETLGVDGGIVAIHEVEGNTVNCLGGHTGGGLFYWSGTEGKLSKVDMDNLAFQLEPRPDQSRKFVLGVNDRLLAFSDGLTDVGAAAEVTDERVFSAIGRTLSFNPGVPTTNLLALLRFIMSNKGFAVTDDCTLFSIENNASKNPAGLKSVSQVSDDVARRMITAEEALKIIVPPNESLEEWVEKKLNRKYKSREELLKDSPLLLQMLNIFE